MYTTLFIVSDCSNNNNNNRVEGRDLIVHFDVRFDARYRRITVSDVIDILLQEIEPSTSKYLATITIDPTSLEVLEDQEALNADSTKAGDY